MRPMSDSSSTFEEEVRAGRDAEAATLQDDAIAHYEAALTQLPPSADEAELLTALGSVRSTNRLAHAPSRHCALQRAR